MKNIGLVLEGGGMRGVYTSGALDFFMDKGLYFPYTIGVSAGACNSLSYISRQRGRNKIVTIDYIDHPRYISYKNLIKKKSIFDMDLVFDEIPNKLEPFDFDRFHSSSEEVAIGVTNCITGEPDYFYKSKCKDILKVVRASSSLPLAAPMINIDGKEYLDGGIADPIPIKKSISDGNDKNILVLTRDKTYRKSPVKLKKLIEFKYSDYPGLIEAMTSRYERYNETLDYIETLEKEGKVIVIRPSEPPNVSRLEKDKGRLTDLYTQGYNDAKELYDKIKLFIKEKGVCKGE
ncbi:patatin-like phospholipase family protein [Dethiothermospora halolimnae]|uniref:patatin-like phospholipase family protein n=1 Tax=Dethiothermospora halolimnae TaxID=3114390 RepID=UPI003CCBD719